MDSQSLVPLINSAKLGGWPLCNTLHVIRLLVRELGVELVHAVRQANSIADSIATARLESDKFFESVSSLPCRTKAVLVLDTRSFPFVRDG